MQKVIIKMAKKILQRGRNLKENGNSKNYLSFYECMSVQTECYLKLNAVVLFILFTILFIAVFLLYQRSSNLKGPPYKYH